MASATIGTIRAPIELAVDDDIAGDPAPARLGFPRRRPHIGVMTEPTTLERAFALARSGACTSVQEIRIRLKRERFDNVEAHLAGPSLGRQLRALCDAARLPAAA